MAKKRTPVTSVTPKSTVKPVSKAQQARTRKLIAGIASVTPVGRAAKTTSKVIGKAIDKVTETKYLDGAYRTAGNEPGIKAALNARKVAKSFEKYYATAKPTRGYKDNPNPPKKVVPKKAVRVLYSKQAMENAIKDGQFKTKRPDMSPSRPAKSAPSRPNLVKIDSSIKTKTIKTKTDTRALKAANKKKSK